MLPISICMIAKNEEAFLEECLQRLAPLDCEIIVLDTGSTDQTCAIAQKYASSLYHYTWCNDFSAARNYITSKASFDWVLHIDCDEFLETPGNISPSQEKKNWLTTISQIKELMEQQSPTNPGFITLFSPYQTNPKASESCVKDNILRFFHREYFQFTGTIHEQVTSKDNKNTMRSFLLPLSFYHKGYWDFNTRKQKAARNIALLEKDLQTSGPDPYTYFQLGQSYFAIQEIPQACYYYDLGLSLDIDPKLTYVQTMVESYGYCLLELKEYQHALLFENIYHEFCHHADFVFLMGLIYMNNARFWEAIEQFQKATTISSYSVNGVNSYSAYYNIGVIYECMGNKQEACDYYAKCLNYTPAMQRLQFLKKE